MIKILIVDDSETEIQLIKHILSPEPDMTVIGVARNGKEAIELTALLKPDLITMDIQMPEMDGLEATRIIMSQDPTPIVVISSTVSDESLQATFHILEAGALSALAKPQNVFSADFAQNRKRIIDTLRGMAEIRVAKKSLKKPKISEKLEKTAIKHTSFEIVAIGVSVGGPQALKTIFSQLNPEFSVPIVVVQHMSAGFMGGYVKWLSNLTKLEVKEAQHLDILTKNTIYIAPDSHHFEVDRILGKLHAKLVRGQPIDGFYPSITALLKSVAKTCNKHALAGLLTGMGFDGAEGLMAIKKAEGHTFIQDPESAVVFGMAGVAQSMGAVDKVIELNKIAAYLNQLCGSKI